MPSTAPLLFEEEGGVTKYPSTLLCKILHAGYNRMSFVTILLQLLQFRVIHLNYRSRIFAPVDNEVVIVHVHRESL